MQSAQPAPSFDDLEPVSYGSKLEAPVYVYGLSLGIPLVALGVLGRRWWRARRRAREAEAREADATAPLGEPGERVVGGTVAEVEGEGPAVVVRVIQLGGEHESSRGWSTTWVEMDRVTEARPFSLALADGTRVRVEPGPSPRLVDALGGWEPQDRTHRVALAELVLGERVFAAGELVRSQDATVGYRGAETLVLRAPRGEPMLLSTQGLGHAARAEQRRTRAFALVVLVAAVVAQLLALPYHLAVALGERRTGVVEGRSMLEATSSEQSDRYWVRYRVEGSGEVVTDEVTAEDYATLPEGTRVPVHVSPLETTIGPHPTLHVAFGGLPPFVLALVCGFALAAVRERTAWYDRKLSETVSGRLP